MIGGFNFFEVVGGQALVVKEELHALVLVLTLLEVDTCLFELLRAGTGLGLAISSVCGLGLSLGGVEGVVVVSSVKLGEHLPLGHGLAFLDQYASDTASNLKSALGSDIGFDCTADGDRNRLLNTIGDAKPDGHRLVGRNFRFGTTASQQ